MVREDSLKYAIGNLLAGPRQWKRMHATGAIVAFIVNIWLASLNLVPALYSGSSSEAGASIATFVLEFVNAVFGGLLALAMGHVGKFTITVLLYVIVGLTVWTVKYDLATR